MSGDAWLHLLRAHTCWHKDASAGDARATPAWRGSLPGLFVSPAGDGKARRGPHILALTWLLARRPDGFFVAPFETGENGPDLFRAACNTGLEGMVEAVPQRAGLRPSHGLSS